MNQQYPRPAIGWLPAEQGFKLLLRCIRLFQVVQGHCQVIAIVGIVRLQLDRARQCEQGEFALAMADQPAPQFVLQEGRIRSQRQCLGQYLPGLVVMALTFEQAYLGRQGVEVVRV
ncbi:hypothetical protein D3C79_842130 [compost metagenome]